MMAEMAGGSPCAPAAEPPCAPARPSDDEKSIYGERALEDVDDDGERWMNKRVVCHHCHIGCVNIVHQHSQLLLFHPTKHDISEADRGAKKRDRADRAADAEEAAEAEAVADAEADADAELKRRRM